MEINPLNPPRNESKGVLALLRRFILNSGHGRHNFHNQAIAKFLDEKWYLTTYPDVAQSKWNPTRHFLLNGLKEGRKPNQFFDPAWYKMQNKEIDNICESVPHYINYGWKIGYWPGPDFSPGRYLDKYPDVAAAKIEPLTHFLNLGRYEGRDTAFSYIPPELAADPRRAAPTELAVDDVIGNVRISLLGYDNIIGCNEVSEWAVLIESTAQSDLLWTDELPVSLSYHWVDRKTNAYVKYDGERTLISSPLKAGEQRRCRLRIHAPQDPQTATLRVTAVHEHRFWFDSIDSPIFFDREVAIVNRNEQARCSCGQKAIRGAVAAILLGRVLTETRQQGNVSTDTLIVSSVPQEQRLCEQDEQESPPSLGALHDELRTLARRQVAINDSVERIAAMQAQLFFMTTAILDEARSPFTIGDDDRHSGDRERVKNKTHDRVGYETTKMPPSKNDIANKR